MHTHGEKENKLYKTSLTLVPPSCLMADLEEHGKLTL